MIKIESRSFRNKRKFGGKPSYRRFIFNVLFIEIFKTSYVWSISVLKQSVLKMLRIVCGI